jgi:hypothetical protein
MTGPGESGPRSGRTFICEVGTGESASTAVGRAVAAVDGHGPRGVVGDETHRPPLYAVVDPDALDAVQRSFGTLGGDAGRVQFSYCGSDVTVTPGSVHVRS